jgi:thiazole synthase
MKQNLDKLKIGDKVLIRLMLGTGKYKTPTDAIESIESSGCEIVTVAIRRLPTDLKMIIQTFK